MAEADVAELQEELDKYAEKVVEAAENGEAWAIKEIGDSLDGEDEEAAEESVDDDLRLSQLR